MHIAEIGIEGFGVFHQASLQELTPGILVFEGHNEAGKSTLMSFIKAMLFGFEGRRGSQNRYEPVRGGRHGGFVVLQTEEGSRYRIERTDENARGRATVLDVDGGCHEETFLHELLHGTSKLLYQNVFAFGLSELERLDTLQEEEISTHIYTVGMGTGLTPVTTVFANLENEQNLLFRPSGKKPSINLLLHKLEQTQMTLRELQSLPDEYYSLQDRLLVLDRKIIDYRDQLESVNRQIAWLESLVKAWSDWENLVRLRREIQVTPHIDQFPVGGVERLDQIERELASLDNRLEEAKRAIDAAEVQQRGLNVNTRIVAHRQEISQLDDLRGSYQGMLERLPELREKVARRRKVLDDSLANLGPHWSDERVKQFDVSRAVRERIREFDVVLKTEEQQIHDVRQRREDLERTRSEQKAKLDRLQNERGLLPFPATPGAKSLEEQEKGLRDWVELFHQLELLRQERRLIREQEEVLNDPVQAQVEEIREAENLQGVPVWVFVMIGICFSVPATVFAIQREHWKWSIALLVSGLAIIGILAWRRYELKAHRRVRLRGLRQHARLMIDKSEELQQRAEELEIQYQQRSQDLTALSQEIVGYELTSLESAEEALCTVDTQHQDIEQWQDLEARIREEEETQGYLLDQGDSIRKSLLEIEQSHYQTQDSWNAYARNLSISEAISPEEALETLSAIERAQGQFREWQDISQELALVDSEIMEMNTKMKALVEVCEWDPMIHPPSLATFAELQKALNQSFEARAESNRLEDLVKEKRVELEKLQTEKDRMLEQCQLLLQDGGATDPETFRKQSVIYAQKKELEKQCRELEVAIQVHAGSPERLQEMEHVYNQKSCADLEQELEELARNQSERVVNLLNSTLQEKGRVAQQVQDFEQSDRLSKHLLEHHALVAQLEQQTERWAVRALCQHLLEKARHKYEHERQPAILKLASKFFNTMTKGNYVRILVPLGEMRLAIESAEGKVRTTDVLSRATAEQLYLAMRMAFVREYAKHAGPLPLIMDDIFVNFDPDRARAAIQVLGEIAETHQILVFTCHSHVTQWFRETLENVSVRKLPGAA